jgi:GNAT superfamily N-acetyltransferase
MEQIKHQSSAENVRIVPYDNKYQSAFRKLNEDWIRKYFNEPEKSDHDALEHPKEFILDHGGFIFVALLNDSPVGVCALLKRDDAVYPYELAKMVVAPEARGKNIGRLLCQAAIEKARALGAQKLFLESNTVLAPALSLYGKLGFKRIVGLATPYQRCNIQMELVLV